ncbi:MAG: trimethyllysine dioxygenase [Woeseiaceae bacterium]|nr:trimethyllysine dioxygenase [Woeseiaceae bacterium]
MSNLALIDPAIDSKTRYLERIVETEDGLEVTFPGGPAAAFSWFWLRDHGVDEASLDPDTLQRRVDTFAMADDVAPTAVRIEAEADRVEIEWPDAPPTRITGRVLAEAAGLTAEARPLASDRERRLWGRHAPLTELPAVAYDAVITSDAALHDWLRNIVVYGFSLVKGVPSTEDATRVLAERIGRIEETIFGGLWTLSAELKDHGDTAYSTQYLEPHTDSSYYHDAPGLQLFNCLAFAGKGGESVQVDGFAIAERIRKEDPEAYRTLTEVSVPARYLEPGVHLRAERPPLRLDARGQLVQVTFNNYDRAPFHLPAAEMQRFYRAYRLFHAHVMDQDNWLKIPLRPGLALIFDNWRNLHGRMGYVGKRVFAGCYINRAEFESRLRVLRAA